MYVYTIKHLFSYRVKIALIILTSLLILPSCGQRGQKKLLQELDDKANLLYQQGRYSEAEPYITLSSSNTDLSVSQVQSMHNMSILSKESWGFYGHSTINHDYESRIINNTKIVLDKATNLMWYHWHSPSRLTSSRLKWQDAKSRVKDLGGFNRGGHIADYSDWRLPTVEEAASLLESSKRNGLHIDPVFDDSSRWIWTSDSCGSGYAWIVDFYYGQVRRHNINGVSGVYLVRSIAQRQRNQVTESLRSREYVNEQFLPDDAKSPNLETITQREAATFVSDVTVPDGTVMEAGQNFTKTWRIRNSGTIPLIGCNLDFVGGAQMDAPPSVAVPTTKPGETVDISVTMKAPTKTGVHKSDWWMRTVEGKFLINVFVIILVEDTTTPLVKQALGSRSILYLDAEGREPVIKGVSPDGRSLGTLVRSSERGCIVCTAEIAVWSPDGSVFSYIVLDTTTKKYILYAQNLQGEFKPIFTTEEIIVAHTWSPDGHNIAMLSKDNVTVIDIADGKASNYVLADFPQMFTSKSMPYKPSKFRWSPDSRKILLSWGATVVIDITTGHLKTITNHPVFAEWGPKSNAVYYFDIEHTKDQMDWGDFYLKKLDSSPPTKLMNAEQLKKVLGLTEVDLVTVGTGGGFITLSPTGSLLSITSSKIGANETDIYIYDLRQGKIINLDKPFKSLQVKKSIIAMEWAPNEMGLAGVAVGIGIEIIVFDFKTEVCRTLAIIPPGERGEAVVPYYLFGFKTISWTQ